MLRGVRIVVSVAAMLAQAVGACPAFSQATMSVDTMRALQIGLIHDIASPPSEADLQKQLRTADTPRRIPTGRPTASPKMVGGKETPGFKEVVRITFDSSDGNSSLCSGIIFEEAISGIVPVLTAGHCSCGVPSSYRITHEGQEKLHFVLASLPSRYRDYSCLLAPEYQSGRDLAVLWIRESSDEVAIGPQPEMSGFAPFIGTPHQIFQDAQTTRLLGVGYGLNEFGREPKTTVAAMIPIQSHFCAKGSYAASVCAPFREFVLADPQAGPGVNRADSCGGDSGSPIFWAPPPVTPPPGEVVPKNVRFLVGVTSRALAGVQHNPGTLCGGGGIYTAVGHPEVVRWLGMLGVFARAKVR